MIEKVKAGKIPGGIHHVWHPIVQRGIDRQKNLILFYLFKNIVYKDLKVQSTKRKFFALKGPYET